MRSSAAPIWQRATLLLCLLLPACTDNTTPISKSKSIPVESEQANPDPEPTATGEALFEGWKSPSLALLITGQQIGYIEPCGCTGLANQKGGLARRHTLVKQLQERGWPLVPLDAGNQVRRFGRQAETKFQVAVDGLKKIGYRAIALGDNDLRLSADVVASSTMAMSEDEVSPFVCANAAVLDRGLTPQFQIIDIAGKKVGVTAILGSAEQKRVVSTEVILHSPEEGLNEVVPKLRAANCDLLVLLSHASAEESRKLARAFNDFDIVVATGGANDPAFQPETIKETDSILVQTGEKAMFAVVIGVFDEEEQPLRYQRVPLDARFADSDDMMQILASYQNGLKDLGLEGLQINPVLHTSGNRFVGSIECKECHQKAFAVWESTPHAKATDSLVHPNERSEIPRHYDPECLSCHVTGWHPKNYFPYEGGYLGLESTPKLTGNGCENCHGPGSRHVAAERGDIDASDEMLAELRNAMKLPYEKAEQKCAQCHDIDNDPDFIKDEHAFKKYWPTVEHPGKD